MAPPLGIQLYTVRTEAERDLAGVLERIAAIGYTGVEIVSLHGFSPAQFRRRLDDLGLQLVGAFIEPPTTEAEWDGLLQDQVSLRNDAVILSLPPADLSTRDAVRRSAERINEIADRLGRHGLKLGYHNHWWEFEPGDGGRLPMTELLGELDPQIFLELDVYWLRTAGLDPATMLPELGSRVRRLHVKDGPCTKGEPQTAVGAGKLDIPGALAVASDLEWHVVELDEYDGEMFEAVEASYRYLTGRGLSRGRV